MTDQLEGGSRQTARDEIRKQVDAGEIQCDCALRGRPGPTQYEPQAHYSNCALWLLYLGLVRRGI